VDVERKADDLAMYKIIAAECKEAKFGCSLAESSKEGRLKKNCEEWRLLGCYAVWLL
jgi:hypothetical protein